MSVTFSGYDARKPHPRIEGAFKSVSLSRKEWPLGGLNLCQGNAQVFLNLIGIKCSGEDMYGSMPMHEARRAVILARATFDRKAEALTRPTEIGYGAPTTNPDGTVEMRPVRFVVGGLDKEGLAVRLDAFEKLIADLEKAGATHVSWG